MDAASHHLTRVISPLGSEIHIQYGREWRTVIDCDFDLALRPLVITYIAAPESAAENRWGPCCYA